MDKLNAKKEWEEYRRKELESALPALSKLGITLDATQPHLLGERYLMSGKKLVLVGRKGVEPVIIKISSEQTGRKEIEHEHHARQIISELKFAYKTLSLPPELFYTAVGRHTILVTPFLAQEKDFIRRPIEEQFTLALQALKAQEGIHATTFSHAKVIRNVFGLWGASDYISSFKQLYVSALPYLQEHSETEAILERALDFLEKNSEIIEQYSGFLTHADFLPHNLRVKGAVVYLLDQTSLHFGNKYESWARFMNFMMLYNPPLEAAFLRYIKDNRTLEEYLSLRVLRAYKLAFLISFYAQSLPKTENNLQMLTHERIRFWTHALHAILEDQPLPQEVLEGYAAKRDQLRSDEEKKRQEGLH